MLARFRSAALIVLLMVLTIGSSSVRDAFGNLVTTGTFGSDGIWAFSASGDVYRGSENTPNQWFYRGNVFGDGSGVVVQVAFGSGNLWAFTSNGDVYQGMPNQPYAWFPWGNVFGSGSIVDLAGGAVGSNNILWAFAANGDVYQGSTNQPNGSWFYWGNVLGTTGVSLPAPREETTWGAAKSASLGAPRPNPFNPTTEIAFTLETASDVDLRIHNASGTLVRTLVEGPRTAGSHVIAWDGRDASGGALASGTYFYQLRVNGQSVGSQKAVILK